MENQSSPRAVHALFVGIDAYPSGTGPLEGCVNDVVHMRDLLGMRLKESADRFAPLLLTDEQATRNNIIRAWRDHLGQAGPGDVALFYYAGHGSQEQAPPEFWDFEPDRRNETLVCFDSRLSGGWHLADKELAQLISEVTAAGPHLIVILDCCHSGGGTRELGDAFSVRETEADTRARPIDSYIVTPQQVAGLYDQHSGVDQSAKPWAVLASGRHILLAACRPEQKAKESSFGAEKRGVFSYYLQESLQQAGTPLSYRDLFKRINALVAQKTKDQNPQLEATEPADLDQPFLGGVIPAVPPSFTLSSDKVIGWVVDAGAIHGIPQPLGDGETTQLAIFPFDTELANTRKLEQAIGSASVTQVYPGQSVVIPTRFDNELLETNTTYRVVITSVPLPPLTVAFEGDEAGLDYVRTALAAMNGPGQPSLLARESNLDEAEYRLVADAQSGHYRIRRVTETLSFAIDTPGLNIEDAQLAALRLEHIARWTSVARLINPATELPPDAIRMDIFRDWGGNELELLDNASDLQLACKQVDGVWRWPRIQIRLHNTTTDQSLFCVLLDLTESYRVYPGLLRASGVWLKPGQETWATVTNRNKESKTITLFIPRDLYDQGVTEKQDILKLIVSTDEADATLLEQDDLPIEVIAPAMRAIPGRLNTLSRLMNRVHMRDLGSLPGSDEELADWTTVETVLTITRPSEVPYDQIK